MDKKTALIILIKYSFFLEDAQKIDLIRRLDNLTDEQINKLGKFLALEKKKSIESIEVIDKFLDKIISER